MVRHRILIVLRWGGTRRDRINEKGGAVEGSAEARDQGTLFYVRGGGERAGAAAENVGGGGLGEGEAGTEI